MKAIRKVLTIMCFAVYLLGSFTDVNAESTSETVHVIKLHGEVNDAMADYLIRELTYAEENNMNVVLDIDTWGGLITSADEISNALLNTNVNTTAFVSGKAISAGVILTISCDHIAMKDSAHIGGAEPIPNTEKVLAVWKGMLSTAAQQKGRDEDIILSMADSRIEVDGVTTEGQLLSLSAARAVELGIADVIAEDIDEVLNTFEIGTDYSYAPFTTSDKVARALTSTIAMNIFFTLGFVLLIVEIYTAGFGIAGTLSIICFVLYYFGGIIAGTAQWWSIILFIGGIVFLIVEMFIPGFGVFGITGFIMCLAGLAFSSASIEQFAEKAGIAMLVCIVLIPILYKIFGKLKLFDKVTNKEVQTVDEGYSVIKEFEKVKIGQEAIVVNDLRPVGTIDIDGTRYDAYTDDGYIQKGDKVEIVGTKASSVIVRKK